MSRISQLRSNLDQRIGQRTQLEHEIGDLESKIGENQKDLCNHEKAREIVRQVALSTQEQLQYHISDITSMALESIFPNPYELVAEFVQRRNKTECDLYFQRDGNRINPIEASGVGAIDVATLALRVAAWSMKTPHSRNVLLMDEPLRYLSVDMQEKASQMIKELSERLGLQFIIITHEAALAEHADKLFRVRIKNGKSKVTEE